MEEKLIYSLQVIWPLKYSTFFQLSSSQNSSFLPINRSSTYFEDGGPLLTLHTSHKMLSTVLKCSQPRTSDTALSASGIVAGPYSPLFSQELAISSHSVAQQLETTLFDLPRGPFIVALLLEYLTLYTADAWKDYTAACQWLAPSCLRCRIYLEMTFWHNNTSFSVKKIWFVFLKNPVILRTFVISLPSLDTPSCKSSLCDQHENIFPCVEFNKV